MYSCESFLDYAYEGEVKIPLVVRIQNAITKVIEMIKKFTLMVRSIKKEHVVPKKALDAYRSLSKMCFNCINKCKSSLQSGGPVKVIFNEPFDSPEYKTLFNEDIKKKTPPGEYVKIASNEVLGFMNGALTALSNAKQALRVVKADTQPNQAQAFTQIINYSKFMLKISNRVLSYKNMYVEPRHLPTTKVDDSNAVNEAYQTCIEEIDIAMEGIFGNLFKKNKQPTYTPEEEEEITNLEKDIGNETVIYLLIYIKQKRYDVKYKKYVDIRVKSSNYIQVTNAKPGEIEDEWLFDIIRVGSNYINTKCILPDKYGVHASDGDDGQETGIYFEIYKK